MKIEQNGGAFRAGALWFLILGVLLGVLLIVTPVDSLLKMIFVVIGIITIFYQIPGFVMGLMHLHTGAGILSFVLSLISMAMGVAMIFFHSTVLVVILGVYLIVLPAVQLLLSKQRATQWKAELPKIMFGVVLLFVGPATALSVLFDVAGWVIIGLSVVYTLISLLVKAGKRAKYENTTGNRVFVDTTGDGKIDTVYVDTTGDGEPDTARRYRDDK
ncbi:MAG: hypothetical protein IKJ35_05755 [Clostridia bacterium]|nr:hypothetical protein [Clostridia bacterium]